MYTITSSKSDKTQKIVRHIYASVQPSDTVDEIHGMLSRTVAELEAVRVGEDQRVLIHCR